MSAVWWVQDPVRFACPMLATVAGVDAMWAKEDYISLGGNRFWVWTYRHLLPGWDCLMREVPFPIVSSQLPSLSLEWADVDWDACRACRIRSPEDEVLSQQILVGIIFGRLCVCVSISEESVAMSAWSSGVVQEAAVRVRPARAGRRLQVSRLRPPACQPTGRPAESPTRNFYATWTGGPGLLRGGLVLLLLTFVVLVVVLPVPVVVVDPEASVQLRRLSSRQLQKSAWQLASHFGSAAYTAQMQGCMQPDSKVGRHACGQAGRQEGWTGDKIISGQGYFTKQAADDYTAMLERGWTQKAEGIPSGLYMTRWLRKALIPARTLRANPLQTACSRFSATHPQPIHANWHLFGRGLSEGLPPPIANNNKLINQTNKTKTSPATSHSGVHINYLIPRREPPWESAAWL